MIWEATIYIIASYLIGSIPTGYIIAKKLKGIDIREHGSGNVGATNVKRVVGSKAGLATLILDCLKGFIPVSIAMAIFRPPVDPYQLVPVLSAIAVVLGHSKSIYIGFSGGKSVITSLGVFLALEPLAALISALVAISVIKMTRYVSLGSMIGAILLPTLVWVFHRPLSHLIVTTLTGLYIIYLHRSNIKRLVQHQENQL